MALFGKAKIKTKVLNIKDIIFKKDLYPRMKDDWLTAYQYFNALKAGAVFPDIAVAERKDKYILIDGLHRLKAYGLNKQDVVSAEILYGLNDNDIYIEAIKRNAVHGRPFSIQERANIVLKLKDMKMSLATIESLVRIPTNKLNSFVAKRLATVSGQEMVLKAPLKNLAGKPLIDLPQETYSGRSQITLLDEIISLLVNKQIDIENESVKEKLVKLKKLLGQYV